MIGTVVKRILSPKISKITWACTYKCGQKCQFCNIWKENYAATNDKKQMISEQDILESRSVWSAATCRRFHGLTPITLLRDAGQSGDKSPHSKRSASIFSRSFNSTLVVGLLLLARKITRTA